MCKFKVQQENAIKKKKKKNISKSLLQFFPAIRGEQACVRASNA